jgi:hypothetical protein
MHDAAKSCTGWVTRPAGESTAGGDILCTTVGQDIEVRYCEACGVNWSEVAFLGRETTSAYERKATIVIVAAKCTRKKSKLGL